MVTIIERSTKMGQKSDSTALCGWAVSQGGGEATERGRILSELRHNDTSRSAWRRELSRGRFSRAGGVDREKRRRAMTPKEAMLIIHIIGLVALIAMTIYYNRR